MSRNELGTANMSAVKGSSASTGQPAGQWQRPLGPLEVWHHTPWWAIWRPTWRRQTGPHNWSVSGAWEYEYQTNGERAREVLQRSFDDDRPMQERDSRRYPQAARRMPRGRMMK